MTEKIHVDTRETLTLVHSSMQYSDPREKVKEDAYNLFSTARDRNWDAISFTEAGNNPVDLALRNQAGRVGFNLLSGPGGAKVALAPTHKLLEVVSTIVVAAYHAPHGRPGTHGPRAIFGPVFQTPAGNVAAYLTFHNVTGYGSGNPTRDAKVEALTRAAAEHIKAQARNRRVAFWSCDSNEPDDPENTTGVDKMLTDAGLVSGWDEAGKYPDAHGKDHGRPGGGTIDIIGSYDPDARVSLDTIRAVGGRHSDHDYVVARYIVEPTLK